MASSHLPDADLIRLVDAELDGASAATARAHIESCARCRLRFDQVRDAFAGYDEYHAEVLRPSLESESRVSENTAWPSLQSRLLLSRKQSRFSWPPVAVWATLAALCLLASVLYFQQKPQVPEMPELLTEASAVPATPHRRLQFVAGGHSWFRPALLSADASLALPMAQQIASRYVQALFVGANYNWEDPLSARSFSAWRGQLRNRRDRVTSVGTKGTAQHLYRLRTETTQGLLRAAALTLRADTLGPVKGDFEFESNGSVTIADAGVMPEDASATVSPRRKFAPNQEAAIETKVGPADELRVLAALDAIGADVDEPLQVETDAANQHVVVAGMGLQPEREQQIRQTLSTLPGTLFRFNSAAPPRATTDAGTANAGAADAYSSGVNAAFLQRLEQRAGGLPQFQVITDRALEASHSLLTQAHALRVLAQMFPPVTESAFSDSDRAVLRTLRHRHSMAVARATLQLGEALKPLLETQSRTPDATPGGGSASSQRGAEELFNATRLLDQSVSRILAARYPEQKAAQMLSELRGQIEKVETLARAQAAAE